MYYIRFTDNKELRTSFNHFTKEEFEGLCAYPLGDVEENGLAYEIRQNIDPTYQKAYNGKFIVFTGCEIMDNPNNEGVIVKLDEIIAEGNVSYGDYGWVIKELNKKQGWEEL